MKILRDVIGTHIPTLILGTWIPTFTAHWELRFPHVHWELGFPENFWEWHTFGNFASLCGIGNRDKGTNIFYGLFIDKVVVKFHFHHT